jgi:hypothetical protein
MSNDKNLNQNGNGGLDSNPGTKASKLPTDSTSMSVTSQISVGPIKQVDGGKLGDVAGPYVNSAADNGGPRNKVNQFDDPPSVTSLRATLHGSGSGESQR